MAKQAIYLWQQAGWPHFEWRAEDTITLLGEVRNLLGQLSGRMTVIGLSDQTKQADALTAEIIGSSQIEGVLLNADSVRSSVARHLGLLSDGAHYDHYTEGIVNVMMEATQHAQDPLTPERLFGWHAALFPTGYSNGIKITAGAWRRGDEPMQVVSGAMGKEKVHFEAPPSSAVPGMMEEFLDWLNTPSSTDELIRAAIAHLWLVTIHPFDDGNGRLTRTVTERMLARTDGCSKRYYSLSAEIMRQRKAYYEALEKAQHSRDMDVTSWLVWFLSALTEALRGAILATDRTLQKAAFWNSHRHLDFNERQRKVLNQLWDGFEGNLTTQKWAKIAHCSQDTALRDIDDLIAKSILRKTSQGGRSTSYELAL